jgi:hypothetical protein
MRRESAQRSRLDRSPTSASCTGTRPRAAGSRSTIRRSTMLDAGRRWGCVHATASGQALRTAPSSSLFLLARRGFDPLVQRLAGQRQRAGHPTADIRRHVSCGDHREPARHGGGQPDPWSSEIGIVDGGSRAPERLARGRGGAPRRRAAMARAGPSCYHAHGMSACRHPVASRSWPCRGARSALVPLRSRLLCRRSPARS